METEGAMTLREEQLQQLKQISVLDTQRAITTQKREQEEWLTKIDQGGQMIQLKERSLDKVKVKDVVVEWMEDVVEVGVETRVEEEAVVLGGREYHFVLHKTLVVAPELMFRECNGNHQRIKAGNNNPRLDPGMMRISNEKFK